MMVLWSCKKLLSNLTGDIRYLTEITVIVFLVKIVAKLDTVQTSIILCGSDALRTICLTIDSENGVFQIWQHKVVLNWQAQLELNPGDSDIVAEFATSLQSKRLSLA